MGFMFLSKSTKSNTKFLYHSHLPSKISSLINSDGEKSLKISHSKNGMDLRPKRYEEYKHNNTDNNKDCLDSSNIFTMKKRCGL